MTWVDLSAVFQYGTKLTSTQMQNLRDNITALANGDSGAPPIKQAALSTSTGSIFRSVDTLSNKTLPGGEYGFYPRIKNEDAGVYAEAKICYDGEAIGDSYVCNIAIRSNNTDYSTYVEQRYISSSGEVHWIFFLKDKATGKLISGWQAPDHPCFGNGGKPELISHPFRGYDPTKHEIIVVNPSKEQVEVICQAMQTESETKPDKDFLEAFFDLYEIDESQEAPWPTKEVTVALPAKWSDLWIKNQPAPLVKKQIPKPDYVLCRGLKLKAGKP
jgi:hypothetical protein